MSSVEGKSDFIIAGAGCAGLSLIVRMLSNQSLSEKRILLIDKEIKKQNDRTWCFWEKGPGFFEPIIHRRWESLEFHSESSRRQFDINPYKYKMIRSVDFYEHCNKIISGHKNIQVVVGGIESITNSADGVTVVAGGRAYKGRLCFNSTLNGIDIDESKHILIRQHFKGWMIRTNNRTFDPGKATLMDFRVSQSDGTAFFYVLPLSEDRALVEYTLFTKDLIAPDRYDESLRQYIAQHITKQGYEVLEEEYGVIPMTNYPFGLRNGNIFNIGTAGGQTKGSTGYTFQFIQKHSDKIVRSLAAKGHPHIDSNPSHRRFALYDAVLLRVLSEGKLGGAEVFTKIFSNGSPLSILRFLDNESNFFEELAIMNRLPKGIFGVAAMKELLSRSRL
jgi:lycopene beta-cyclase